MQDSARGSPAAREHARVERSNVAATRRSRRRWSASASSSRCKSANLADTTRECYVREIRRLAEHYGQSPDRLDAEQIRAWITILIERGLSPASVNVTIAAFKFFFRDTIGRPDIVAGLRSRKMPPAPSRAISRSMRSSACCWEPGPQVPHRNAARLCRRSAHLGDRRAAAHRHQVRQATVAHPLGQGRHRTHGPSPQRGPRVPAQLLAQHLPATAHLAVLRQLSGHAHQGSNPHLRLQHRSGPC